MNDIRSFASLSGSLLARKGGAKPAMRPRPLGQSAMLDDLGWDDMGYAPEQPTEHVPSSIAGLTPAPKVAVARDEQPPVHVQQRALADRYNEPEPETPFIASPEPKPEHVRPAPVVAVAEVQPVTATPAPQPQQQQQQQQQQPEPQPQQKPVAVEVVQMPKLLASGNGRKAAFTLRLDTGRHLRLRLATAITGQSAQQLVTGALDRFLETLPEVGNMAEQLPAGSTRHS